MARANPEWSGNGAQAASAPSPQPEPTTVTGGTFGAPAPAQVITLAMSPRMAHIVRSAIVTSEVPGELMEEASQLIATLHLFSQGQLNG